MSEYVISVAGAVAQTVLDAYPTMSSAAVPVHTMLAGELPDQCALQGLMTALERHGVEIIEVRRLPSRPPLASAGAVPTTGARG